VGNERGRKEKGRGKRELSTPEGKKNYAEKET
jgi:hypothetical protein